MVYRKKTIKKSSKRKKNTKKIKGGCGCNSQLKTGGGDFFLPGYQEPENINGLHLHNFYPQNTYNVDPQGSQISSRLIGGKRSRRKKQKKSNKKMKKIVGGNMQDYISTLNPLPYNNDMVSTLLSTDNAFSSNNVLTGHQNEITPLGIRYDFPGKTLV